jgi:hypothetical protein
MKESEVNSRNLIQDIRDEMSTIHHHFFSLKKGDYQEQGWPCVLKHFSQIDDFR